MARNREYRLYQKAKHDRRKKTVAKIVDNRIDSGKKKGK